MYGEKHMANSVEVFFKSADRRVIAYGLTREQAIENLVESGLPLEDIVVTKTRVIQRGLGSQWLRGTRGFDDYGEPLTG